MSDFFLVQYQGGGGGGGMSLPICESMLNGICIDLRSWIRRGGL